MKQYILIIKNSTEPAPPPSASEAGEHVQKYVAWAQKLRDQGLYVTADGLSDEIRILNSPTGPAQISDGPFAETKEMIGGYYIYQANDFAHAEQIARECPALEYGEVVELREQMDYS